MSKMTKEQFVNIAGQFFRLMTEQEKQIEQLHADNKKLNGVISIDNALYKAIADEYPNTVDLQRKILQRNKDILQTLKGR